MKSWNPNGNPEILSKISGFRNLVHFFVVLQTPRQCRSFQSSWYSKWPWLEWDDEKECAFCHPCRMATILNFITFSKKAEKTFSTGGFQNWKDATRIFRKHDSSHAHKEAVMKWVHYTKSQSVAAQLAQQICDDQAKAQTCLLKIISSLQYIARQGLPSRGQRYWREFSSATELKKDCSYLKEWILRQNCTSMIFRMKSLRSWLIPVCVR